MKSFFSICIFFIISVGAQGQITLDNYLSQVNGEVEIESIRQQQNFVDQNGFKSPIIREVEFRMRSNRFENGLTDYRLRFSPINPWEKASNKRYREAVEEELSLEMKFTLNEVLRVRYQLAVRYLNYLELQKIEQSNVEFYNGLLDVVSGQPGRFSVREVIDLDKALLKAEMQLLDIEGEIDLMNQTILKNAGQDLSINREELISIDEINTWFSDMEVDQIAESNLEIELEEKKYSTEEAEQRIEENQAFNNLGYLQAEYRVDEDRPFAQNIGAQLAVVLPVTNPDKPDLERRRLNLLRDLNSLEEDKNELALVIIGSHISLGRVLEQYDLVGTKLAKYENFRPVSLNSNMDMREVIDLQEMRTYLSMEELNLYCDALNLYIDQLANSGALVSSPMINHISIDKGQIEIVK